MIINNTKKQSICLKQLSIQEQNKRIIHSKHWFRDRLVGSAVASFVTIFVGRNRQTIDKHTCNFCIKFSKALGPSAIVYTAWFQLINGRVHIIISIHNGEFNLIQYSITHAGPASAADRLRHGTREWQTDSGEHQRNPSEQRPVTDRATGTMILINTQSPLLWLTNWCSFKQSNRRVQYPLNNCKCLTENEE